MSYALPQKKHHVRHSVSKPRVEGFTLALLLTFFGFLAYLAVPKGSNVSSPRLFHLNPAGSHSSDALSPKSTVVVIGAPVVGGSSLGLLEHLLPMTNFSQLSSAALLDAAAANGLDHQQVRQLMQLYQNLFCASRMHLQPMAGTTKVPFGNVSLHLYDGSDIVSNELKGQYHTWELAEVQEMLWALGQFKSTQQQQVAAQLRAAKGVTGNQQQQAGVQAQPMFVDIGANIGWFGLNAAAAGARVAAFEAMPSNVALIRRSLCSNPWLGERVALYGTGLGTESSKCHIISGTNNRGDGHTVCDQDVTAALTAAHASSNATYEVRGEMTVRRLDTLLSEDVQVMKIDVEGFELQVLEGSEKLLAKHNVWYIMAEANRGIIKEEGQKRYLRFMDKMGYYISLFGFRGPFVPTQAIQEGTANLSDNPNIYCVKKELLGSEQAAAATAKAALLAGGGVGSATIRGQVLNSWQNR